MFSSQPPPTIPVNNGVVSRDEQWLQKGKLPSVGECGELGCWNSKMVPHPARMRVEFVQTTGYELAPVRKAVRGRARVRIPAHVFSRSARYALVFGGF